MKKLLSFLCIFAFFTTASVSLFAEDPDDSFFSDDTFDDDMFFEEDGIENLEETTDSSDSDDSLFSSDTVTSTPFSGNDASDLSHGILFQNGSIKIGGLFNTSLGTSTTVWQDKDDFNLGESIKDSTLTPKASALLSIDARPSQSLRMYTKFGLSYPYTTKAISTASTNKTSITLPVIGETEYYTTNVNTSVSDYLSLKELFTDFSVADRVFFRFGLHTVTWGTGYFFSPVSDILNTSSIDPEDTSAQVDGCFNLRTQITFPGTQNCLWFYIVPSTDFTSDYSTATYAKETALAGKTDLVFGNWEIGLGGYYKYQEAPKAILTASGSFRKISLFGEALYQYGADTEWYGNTDWDNKTSIYQATVGATYYWKTPQITFACQYYYDSNDKDWTHQYLTQGHNIAAVASFGRLFGTTDFTATVFTMANFGKEEIPDLIKTYLEEYGISSTYLSSITLSAMLNYSPTNEITFTAGPYFTWQKIDSKPDAAFNFTATLGGGKF